MPVSFSIVTTVPGMDKNGHNMLEPYFAVISPDTPDDRMPVEVRKLIIRMYDYLTEVSDVANGLLSEKYKWLLDQLKDKDTQYKAAEKVARELKAKLSGKRRMTGEETKDSIEQRQKDNWLIIANTRDHSTIYKEFLKFLECIPVIGFNSCRFDLNLIRRDLFTHALNVKDIPSIVKRGNAYMAVGFKKFKFLDITSYMGPGISLVGFLAAWGIEDKKCKRYINNSTPFML